MARIAIAGFQHETNSFSPLPAGLAEFEMADSWPGLLTGQEVVSGTQGMNLPVAGFAAAARAAGHDLHPILWCAAEPSGPVTTEAFDTITAQIVDGIEGADGVYLDLHGAMITQTMLDGEGALLSLIRARYGPDLPMVISLDLHANLSQAMVALADDICIFRTYPHLDMAQTGARCLPALERILSGQRRTKVLTHAPYLIPMHAQCTDDGPVAELYALATALDAELAMGFTSGDTPHTGPAWITFGAEVEAQAISASIARAFSTAEPHLARPLPDAPTVVQAAMALAQKETRPVVIADVEDNAGGGGSSDTMGLFAAMVAQDAQGALLGVIHDPDAARTAHQAGRGAEITLSLGGRSGCPGDSPWQGRFEVVALGDGRIVYEGEMYGGGIGEIGPTAALRPLGTGADVTAVVSSVRNQCLDPAYFRHLRLVPETARIIGVKSTVHYRAAFGSMAQAILPCRVPGILSSDFDRVDFQHLSSAIRRCPQGNPSK